MVDSAGLSAPGYRPAEAIGCEQMPPFYGEFQLPGRVALASRATRSRSRAAVAEAVVCSIDRRASSRRLSRICETPRKQVRLRDVVETEQRQIIVIVVSLVGDFEADQRA